MSEPLSNDQSATPKTDAVTRSAQYWPISAEVVPVHFARAQERRIAELEKALRDVRGEIEAYSGLRAEYQDWSDAFAVIAKVQP